MPEELATIDPLRAAAAFGIGIVVGLTGEAFSHTDMLPTLAAVAGEPDIVEPEGSGKIHEGVFDLYLVYTGNVVPGRYSFSGMTLSFQEGLEPCRDLVGGDGSCQVLATASRELSEMTVLGGLRT